MAETESESMASLTRFIPPRPQENNQFTKPAGFGQSQVRDDTGEESLKEDTPARVNRTQEFIPPPRPNKSTMFQKRNRRQKRYDDNGPEENSARMLTQADDDFIPPPRPNENAGQPGYKDRSVQQGANGPEDRSASNIEQANFRN